MRQRRKGLPSESSRTNSREADKLLAEAKAEVGMAVKIHQGEEADTVMQEAEVPGKQRQPLHSSHREMAAIF